MEFRRSNSTSRSSSFIKKTTKPSMDADNQLQESLMSEFSSHLRFASDERLKEIREMRKIRKFQKRIKICAYFFMFWAIFILLNACIGFSSAPFYLPDVRCNHLEPTDDCKYLRQLTSALYMFEIIGSLLLVIHGLLLIALIDHVKSLKLIRFIRKYTKIVLALYLLLIICRVGLYIKVQSEVANIDTEEVDQGFGNFLASFVADPKAAIAVTAILLSLFALCFIMNCFTMRLTSNIEQFVLAPPESNFMIQNGSIKSQLSGTSGSGDSGSGGNRTGSGGDQFNNDRTTSVEQSIKKKGFWARLTNKNRKQTASADLTNITAADDEEIKVDEQEFKAGSYNPRKHT